MESPESSFACAPFAALVVLFDMAGCGVVGDVGRRVVGVAVALLATVGGDEVGSVGTGLQGWVLLSLLDG